MDIRELRESYGLTQAELAKKCGVSMRTVQNWEQGKTIPESALRLLKTIGSSETISSSSNSKGISVAAGTGSNVKVGTETERLLSVIEQQQKTIDRQLEEISETRKLVQKRDAQIDQLLGILATK